ncbi:uncharacterized protein AMSG_11923 [Thecamonas trahens ATCC 50062]|uniref:Alpha-methylacyl-CoA racemase n=1 Tax=Thecamonas trahens ATCC 50062 TaxID=461836 RepID=A0A0L0DBG5_THETB|nr:hypothetical protein AMSG_11923 [Thecamonas trahens ATCC 50062]KNC49689.1 hypothetical protein AMSG_11923 [Thecamonas trahens ATCC 50062]|eukprot:XP_013757603.1 hypothetical protein AMSG_11923 [Thecamonas trahens ATCC 50062]
MGSVPDAGEAVVVGDVRHGGLGAEPDWEKCVHIHDVGEACVELMVNTSTLSIEVAVTIDNKTVLEKTFSGNSLCVDTDTLIEVLEAVCIPCLPILKIIKEVFDHIPAKILSMCVELEDVVYHHTAHPPYVAGNVSLVSNILSFDEEALAGLPPFCVRALADLVLASDHRAYQVAVAVAQLQERVETELALERKKAAETAGRPAAAQERGDTPETLEERMAARAGRARELKAQAVAAKSAARAFDASVVLPTWDGLALAQWAALAEAGIPPFAPMPRGLAELAAARHPDPHLPQTELEALGLSASHRKAERSSLAVEAVAWGDYMDDGDREVQEAMLSALLTHGAPGSKALAEPLEFRGACARVSAGVSAASITASMNALRSLRRRLVSCVMGDDDPGALALVALTVQNEVLRRQNAELREAIAGDDGDDEAAGMIAGGVVEGSARRCGECERARGETLRALAEVAAVRERQAATAALAQQVAYPMAEALTAARAAAAEANALASKLGDEVVALQTQLVREREAAAAELAAQRAELTAAAAADRAAADADHARLAGELGGLAPVPFAGMMLADFGAEVVRVDRVGGGMSAGMDSLVRGKRSVAVDLRSRNGRDVLLRLVSKADVLLDPFRPGVLESLGLSPETLHASNSRLIIVRVTGYGQSGERAQEAGHDINYVAASGVLSMLGKAPDSPQPPLNLLADFAGGGLMAVVGVLLGLARRSAAQGHGSVVEVSMADAVRYLAAFAVANRPTLFSRARGSNVLDSGAHFYNVYGTRDGRFVAVGAIEPQFYAALLDGLGLDAKHLPDQNDASGWPAMTTLFQRLFATRDLAEWLEVFHGTDACVTAVAELDGDVAVEPCPKLSGVAHPASTKQQLQSRLRLGAGVHSRDILRSLGYDEAEIEEMVVEGVIGSRL